MQQTAAGRRPCRLLIALLFLTALLVSAPFAAVNTASADAAYSARGNRAATESQSSGAALLVDDAPQVGAGGVAQQQAADSTLEVPWNGVMWQTMPNFTWSACDVSASTRRIIDLAIGQWQYAAKNQGLPIHLSEAPCTDGNTDAQIRLIEALTRQVPLLAGSTDVDVFGLTLARNADNKICGINVSGPCTAVVARVYLFADNWAANALMDAQAAKTVAHEIGHAIGLGHAHFCNFDSIMAQNCEPVLQGLGPDDIESLDALVDHVRASFNQPPLNVQPPAAAPSSGGATITYHAGWNLVAGPRGTRFAAASESLYTMLPGDTTYRTFPATQRAYDSYGYWAYFPQDVTVQLNGSGGSFYTALADPGKWFLVGNNNGTASMRVLGANSILVYDAQSGQYRSTTMVPPGQAAWVKAGNDSLIGLAATSLTRSQLDCYENYGSPSSCR